MNQRQILAEAMRRMGFDSEHIARCFHGADIQCPEGIKIVLKEVPAGTEEMCIQAYIAVLLHASTPEGRAAVERRLAKFQKSRIKQATKN